MTIGIYLITHKVTGDRYVGMSKTIEQRWKSHLRALEKGKHTSKAMQALSNEYGLDSFTFEILEECEPEPDRRIELTLGDAERKWMEQLKPELNLRGTERESEFYRKLWTLERRTQNGLRIRAAWARIRKQQKKKEGLNNEDKSL